MTLANEPRAGSGALSVRRLSKHYELDGRRLDVLPGLDLELAAGEFVSIVGPSGCGKSTLLRLVLGLDGDYEGEILLDGQRVTSTSLDIGMVFQDHRLYPWMTVQQNIAIALLNSPLSARERTAEVDRHIALVGLEPFRRAYPHQISGGMAQRAAIARALINRPKLLLLDEPLGALDALTRINLQQELQRIWLQQRGSMLMVTHDVEEALYLSDRVLVMDRQGRIAQTVEVGLAHPRDRRSPRLHQLCDELLDLLTEPAP